MNKLAGYVIDIKGDNIVAGTPVILWHQKPLASAANQLWDVQNGYMVLLNQNPNQNFLWMLLVVEWLQAHLYRCGGTKIYRRLMMKK